MFTSFKLNRRVASFQTTVLWLVDHDEEEDCYLQCISCFQAEGAFPGRRVQEAGFQENLETVQPTVQTVFGRALCVEGATEDDAQAFVTE